MDGNVWASLLQQIIAGEAKPLARAISLIENEVQGYEQFLQSLPTSGNPIIGTAA